MKSIHEYILEAKFTGFTKSELDELTVLKNEVLDKNKDYLDNFRFDSKRNIVNHKTLPVYGNKYLVYFNSNPLSNTHKFSKTSKSENNNATALEPDEPFYMIGIADKFGRIFLYGKWDEDKNSPFIQYKESEIKTTKTGKKYRVDAGWKLTKKDQEYYKIQYWHDDEKKYGDHFWWPTNYKQIGIYDLDVSKNLKMIFDLNDIPAKVQEILDEIEKKSKEEAERKEKERKNKEYWDKVNSYENLGMANCWKTSPEILNTIAEDPEAKWEEISLGRCYHKYICHKYKVYYTCDSSD